MPDKINIIFDLDGVAIANIPENYEALHRMHPNLYLYFIRNTAFFITTRYPQCVLPGFIELIQFIFLSDATNWIELSFFSAGGKERNIKFIIDLFNHALGEDIARAVLPSIKICSWDDCKTASLNEIKKQRNLFGLHTEQDHYKKNIFSVSRQQNASNTIMVDDHPTIVYPGQEKNYCAIPSASIADFCAALKQSAPCHSAVDILFQRLNNVFYLAGILQTLIAHVQSENKTPITEVLFKLQFQAKHAPQSRTTYAPHFYRNFSNQQWYDAGLELLRQHNPAIHHITTNELLAFIQEPPDQRESQCLEKYITRIPQPTRPTTTQCPRIRSSSSTRWNLFLQSPPSSKDEARPRDPLPNLLLLTPNKSKKPDEQLPLRKPALEHPKFRR